MIVARRYAKALYEEAERLSKTDVVDRDVEFIRASLSGSRELVSFFESPVISREKKESAVRALFDGKIGALSLQFLTLLIRKEREPILSDILAAYQEMRDEQLNIVEAQVRVAEEMSEAEQKKLSAALSEMTGKKIRLEVSQETDLIGGLVIRIGDTVYDGSVQHQLERLRHRMEAGSYLLN